MSNRNLQRERYADPAYRFRRHDERFGEPYRDDLDLDHPGWPDPSLRDVPPEWRREEGSHRDEPAYRGSERFRDAYPREEVNELARPGEGGPIGDVRRCGREGSRRIAREFELARQGESRTASGYRRQGRWETDVGDFAGYGYGSGGYSSHDSDAGREFQPGVSLGRRHSDLQQAVRRHRGPKGYQRSDERIREDICEQLVQRHDLDVSEVSVNVQAGKVTLEGIVCDRYIKHAIEDVADDCFGVKEIDNRIRVVRGDYREQNPLSIGSGSGAGSETESSSTSIGSPASGGTQGLSGTPTDKGK